MNAMLSEKKHLGLKTVGWLCLATPFLLGLTAVMLGADLWGFLAGGGESVGGRALVITYLLATCLGALASLACFIVLVLRDWPRKSNLLFLLALPAYFFLGHAGVLIVAAQLY